VGPSPSGGGPVPSPDWDDVLADIGDRVRAERQARGWSQNRLGRRAGIGEDTVRRVENGEASIRTFALVCAALEVAMHDLLSPRWQRPDPAVRPLSLSERQALVLGAAASGDSLTAVGARLGMDSRAVASNLSRAYRRLGVAHLPQEQRRAAAVRLAIQHGLFNPSNRTS
jgi:transcriptional regulator with XRE-family HTH domain